MHLFEMCFTMTKTARGINTEQQQQKKTKKTTTSHIGSKGPFSLDG